MKHFPEDHSKREHVCLRCPLRRLLKHLRGEVRPGFVRIKNLCALHSPLARHHEAGLVVGTQKDAARVHFLVDDLAVVQELKPLCNAACNSLKVGSGDREREVMDEVCEGAIILVHHQDQVAVDQTGAQDLDNVGVIERAPAAHLAAPALLLLKRRPGSARKDALDRNLDRFAALGRAVGPADYTAKGALAKQRSRVEFKLAWVNERAKLDVVLVRGRLGLVDPRDEALQRQTEPRAFVRVGKVARASDCRGQRLGLVQADAAQHGHQHAALLVKVLAGVPVQLGLRGGVRLGPRGRDVGQREVERGELPRALARHEEELCAV
mmetsp:Transcript_2216/g.6791  ORF Transcript_2216/g.6791 Transcript_2216/m.6791 type:complete len:323 (-) Transcript_2216:12-980(-)